MVAVFAPQTDTAKSSDETQSELTHTIPTLKIREGKKKVTEEGLGNVQQGIDRDKEIIVFTILHSELPEPMFSSYLIDYDKNNDIY